MNAKPVRRVKERGAAYATRTTKSRAPSRALFPQARYLTQKERIALKAFRDYVLKEYPDQIERIVLFGSKARGDSAVESDVDVLVVIGGSGAERTWETLSPNWQAVGHYLFDLSMKYGVGISPKFEYRDDAKKWNPLLAHIHAEGIELWRKRGSVFEPWPEGGKAAMALSRQEHIEARMAIAHEKLATARDLIEKEHYHEVVSCAYYAMFYASKALLLALGEDPYKHEGVISLLGERIAKVGLSDPNYGGVLRNAKDLRIRADYEDFFRATQEQAENSIRNAEDFVNEAQETLKKIQTRGK